MIIFIRIFYLSVFCFPLKRLSQPYESFSQIVLSFTQISCCNIYVALLLRFANDVEENPGPTVYDVVDPSKTISDDFSQGNARMFGQNAGKQCVAMSLTAIVHSHITNVNAWDFSFLNFILHAGNILYTCISSSIYKDVLLLTDVLRNSEIQSTTTNQVLKPRKQSVEVESEKQTRLEILEIIRNEN